MNYDLAQKSIDLALKGSWEEAIKINKEILKETSEDTDTLNRLAKAYFENGNTSFAVKTCQKIIKIDSFNSIALKNLSRWKSVKKHVPCSVHSSKPTSFIEESGKTKIVTLLNLGDAKIISTLNTCDEVFLNAHTHRVSLTTEDGKYIGRLPDDLALRIRRLISLGNAYQSFIKSVDQKEIKIFIKEVQKSQKSKNIPSFPIEKITSEESC